MSSVGFADLTPTERYKLLCATIIPRPIALVTSVDLEGVANAAPISFFNVFSEDPAWIVLGLQHRPGRVAKDTSRNIAETGAFVVNTVDEGLAEAMNVCAIDFPPDVDETAAAGLTLLPGTDVPVPRIAEAPFGLECRRVMAIAPGPGRELVIGEVVRLHAREGLLDLTRMRIDAESYRPVGRLFGNGYANQNERFELERETYAEWRAPPGTRRPGRAIGVIRSPERGRVPRGPVRDGRMTMTDALPSSDDLAGKAVSRFPGESDAYREARRALLAEEIAFRRHMTRVVEQRRALPPGPVIKTDYRFEDETGADLGLLDLFGEKTTLVAYFWMYGPERERPCPMCTNWLGAVDGNAADIAQRVALKILGRSPVARQLAFARERGWRHLDFVRTVGDAYARDLGLINDDGSENPALTVFRREGDTVRLFWASEMNREMADPGQDPRDAPDIASLWSILDLTPEGRGADWYPKLSY